MLPPVICFSPFRWSDSTARPQNLMKRFSADRRVFYIEEPTLTTGAARLAIDAVDTGVLVCTPQLPEGHAPHIIDGLASALLGELVRRERIGRPIAWVFSPAAAPMLEVLDAATVIYDRLYLELLSPADATKDAAILERADLVFDAEGNGHPRERVPASERQTARDLSWWRAARSVTARQAPPSQRQRSTTAPMP